MKVLVTAASRHGTTAEIARAIGLVLSRRGIETEVLPPDEVQSVEVYDAVLIGSSVYAGHWLAPAKKLVEREASELIKRPVWLFSSGPLGEPAKPVEEPVDVAAVRARTRALDHRVFAGKADPQELGFVERSILRLVRAPRGDFRDWPAIEAWATEIVRRLQSLVPLGVR
jgi:menaquinone-dependent protoporphyrinogen oxidase